MTQAIPPLDVALPPDPALKMYISGQSKRELALEATRRAEATPDERDKQMELQIVIALNREADMHFQEGLASMTRDHLDFIHNIVRKKIRPLQYGLGLRIDQEDIVHDALLRIHDRLTRKAGLADMTSLRTFIWFNTGWCISDALSAHGKAPIPMLIDDDSLAMPVDESHLEKLERHELIQSYQSCLSRLRADEREVMRLQALGKTLAQAASSLKRPEGTVRYWYHEAKRKVRACLELIGLSPDSGE